jgi:energy-coupling factor transporter ATP-binding protein EcfA2
MLPLLRQQGYVLTPDFALKLLLLNDTRKIAQNVVLCGDTGVGKTELLNIFALIINSDSKVIPDLLAAAHDFLLEVIEELELPAAKARSLNDRVNDRNAKSMADVVRDLFKEHPLAQDQVAAAATAATATAAATATPPQDAPVPCHGLAWRIVRFVQDIIAKCNLVIQSELVERVLKALPQDEAQSPFSDEAEAGQFFEDFCKSKFRSLFHRILMHQNITAADLRHKVDAIIASTKPFAVKDANFVVFIDECTSTQVMGLVKEIFVDHTLDGRPLPRNIFWVAAMNRNTLEGVAAAAQQSVLDYTGVVATASSSRAFAIRPAHPSLELLVIEFGVLSDIQQSHFLQSLIDMRHSLGYSVGTTQVESK